MTDIILLRYSPGVGLVDAEGKPIGVVCVPKILSTEAINRNMEMGDDLRLVLDMTLREKCQAVHDAQIAAARPDLSAATVKDSDLAAAQARIAELERDAARYRWLRERFFSHWATYRDDVVAASVALVAVGYPRVYGKIGDPKPQFDIDAAIDAARGGA